MSDTLPIVVSIVRFDDRYLFIRRKNQPYAGLWSLIGGKIKFGEHVRMATRREVLEETGASHIKNYEYRGLVTECLRVSNNDIKSHFLIFVSHCEIDRFVPHNREGDLQLFTRAEVESMESVFLPSDWYMFRYFLEPCNHETVYEAELVYEYDKYRLVYFQAAID